MALNGWTVFPTRQPGDPTRSSDIEGVKSNILLNRSSTTGDYTTLPFSADGSAAAPVIKRASSADGLFFANGKVGIAIAGVEVASFDANGINLPANPPSGTYIPTFYGSFQESTVVNMNPAQYIRMGNVCTVSGALTLNYAVASTNHFKSANLIISPPFPTNFTPNTAGYGNSAAFTECAGIVVVNGVASVCSSADKVTFGIAADGIGMMLIYTNVTLGQDFQVAYHYTYQII